MILEPRPGRYQLHRLDSPEAEVVLAGWASPAPTSTAPSPS